MISSIIKLKVSGFILRILENDAMKFDFVKKDGEPNINKLLNKLIPNLVYYRKLRREEIRELLEVEFTHNNAEQIYKYANAVIDKVYFSDAELQNLDEVIWFRPSDKNRSPFDEIEDSERIITLQTTTEYIRSLLNEYSRLPQYKREQLVFDTELYKFSEACATGKIFHARIHGKSVRFFAFHHIYEYTYTQENLLIYYDLTNKQIGAIPLHKVRDAYTVDTKYKPSEKLIDTLQEYYENKEYDEVITYEEDLC